MNLTGLSRTSRQQLAAALIEQQQRQAPARHIPGMKRPEMNLLTWAIIHRRYLKPGLAFDLTTHLYLRDIYACTAQHMVIYKASQMGASEYAVSYAMHACDMRQATVLYVFPKEGHVSDFSAARIGPALEASPYLESIVVEAGKGGKRGADRVTLKRIRDRFWYLRGATVSPSGNAPQLKSIDADVLIFDEWDEMDPRAPDIGRKRLGHSLIAEERDISTPTYPGRGIHKEYEQSDQRQWHVRCEGCGERQPMTINQVVMEWDKLERPVAWHGMEEGRAYVACRKCGRELDRLAAGEWVAEYPSRHRVGFHLTKLFSPTAELLQIVHSLQQTDETKRRECFNQDLGLPYTPRGGQMTDAILDQCQRDYRHGPVPGERPFMGVDVGRVLHVVIRGPANAEGERPQRFAGEVDSFEELANLARRYSVQTCVVDALPETRAARAFQSSFPRGVVWLAYYTGDIDKHQEPATWNGKEGTVTLDRTRMLDITFARFLGDEQGRRVNTLPAGAHDIPSYYDQMKAPVRVLSENTTGPVVARYVESGPDHYAHAENYATAAAMNERWLSW